MIVTILFVVANVFVVATVVILWYLYRTRTQRRLGLSPNGRRQGIQLIAWFLCLGLLVNVVLERLVALLGDRYVLVLLPTLLLMVATMFYILYWKVPEEEHP
ncbi:MAG TPA: hypothetical protein PKD70_14020 [Saprospiraceae bacterium]|nr:hypothetical protein [Saprospiraceae bacterium]HMP14990.1 hypothetical protein [Saprospiraceae bacterium]